MMIQDFDKQIRIHSHSSVWNIGAAIHSFGPMKREKGETYLLDLTLGP